MSKLLSDLIQKNIRPTVRGPTVNGRLDIKSQYPEDFSSSSESEELEDNYAEEYVEQEMRLYSECYKDDIEVTNDGMGLDDIAAELAGSEIRSEVYRMARTPDIYRKYNFEHTLFKRDLTIHTYKEKILNVMRTNSVMVIDGPTGCGKTTQVPQYILDDCRALGKDCNIVVTQPRKIATINVTKRVCQERGWTVGTICGYQIGLEKQLGPDVILAYMTTGVLLQKLIRAKSLSQFTHIIIDEIHERNQDLDFLLLVIRKLLFTKSFQTKVILMSATIDAEEFAHYFRSQYKGNDMNAPIVHIKEPNKFVITKYYMDSLPQPQPVPVFEKYKPEISEGVRNTFLFLMTAFDKLDEVDTETKEVRLGSVLVFLPGIREIEEIEKMLTDKKDYQTKWEIVPLHSSLPNDEQAKAFKPVNPPLRKVILSTNLAESSITVPDISYVVDFCLTKNMVVDKITKFPSLQLEWASHVSCDQRAGRAGRVSNGRVYRLVSKNFYETEMDAKGTPEILRAPLENVVLHTKMLEFNEEPKAVLALSINPPNLNSIENTIWHLKEIGGMLQTCRGKKNISDGDITFLGTIMASLPMDVCFSKLIVLGHMFSVLHEAVIIAAGCSIPNVFATPFNQRFQAYNKKLLWADGSCSDLMALLNLYNVWQSYRRDGAFRRVHEEYAWCKANLVNLKGLREWQLLITEIKARLKRFGIEETSGPAKVNLTAFEKPTILKVIICGAFYPNYFIRSAEYGQIDERDAVKVVGGRDPYKTVYLTGIESGQPGGLYAKEIKKMLDLKDEAKVEFDGTSKVYIEFKNYKEPETVNVDGQQYVTTIPGKIAMYVYHAVKKRQLKVMLQLKTLPKELAWEHFNALEKKQQDKKAISAGSSSEASNSDAEMYSMLNAPCFSEVEYNPLPALDTEYITVVISNRIDAGHFYCQNVHDGTQQKLDLINKLINSTPLTQIDVEKFKPDHLYAAKYLEDGQYYRAKVQIRLSEKQAQVIFVDYGNIQNMRIKDLCELPKYPILRMSPLAIECVLSEIGPEYDVRKGIWNENVNKLFDDRTQNTILYGKVYSVVDDVVHLELFKSLPNKAQNKKLMSINQWLINGGHARRVEEGFLSKQDHDTRVFVLNSDNPTGEATKLGNEKKKNDVNEFEDTLKGVEKFVKPTTLKGPFSPLEMKVFSVIAHGSNKSAEIEPTSINSVLLDNDPLDPHTRLIVAASVNQSPSGDKLLLRQTTIMPNIPGFPFLMALLFCPEMEPKLTEDGTRISSLLCGLGVHENSNRPCYPAHDAVLTLDIEVNEDVINTVNELRYAMNTTLNVMKNIYETESRIEQIEPYVRSVKVKIFHLLRMKLRSVKPFHNKYGEVWKNYPVDMEVLRAPITDENFVWPLHWFVNVRKLDEKPSQMQLNITELTNMAKKLIPFEETRCEICNKDLISLGKYEIILFLHYIRRKSKI
ncbi:hypothetical protein HHI36_002786 [Cryptolaemus montrouzieri]|uniref:Probable ATP-dependent RNA helicase spindle-E n=1 Tax=Cryptolaemus montrouzieri TaxID=559131 RepID=A0ABD2PC45_9CUCU